MVSQAVLLKSYQISGFFVLDFSVTMYIKQTYKN